MQQNNIKGSNIDLDKKGIYAKILKLRYDDIEAPSRDNTTILQKFRQMEALYIYLTLSLRTTKCSRFIMKKLYILEVCTKLDSDDE